MREVQNNQAANEGVLLVEPDARVVFEVQSLQAREAEVHLVAAKELTPTDARFILSVCALLGALR